MYARDSGQCSHTTELESWREERDGAGACRPSNLDTCVVRAVIRRSSLAQQRSLVWVEIGNENMLFPVSVIVQMPHCNHLRHGLIAQFSEGLSDQILYERKVLEVSQKLPASLAGEWCRGRQLTSRKSQMSTPSV